MVDYTGESRKLEQCHGSYISEGLTPEIISRFREIIYGYYRAYGRDFPWRRTDDPYRILVSEIMLQQTQTSRVVQKYEEFIAALPGFAELAGAPLRVVLGLWQGLGYNRRAIYLQRAAQTVISGHSGVLPSSPELLVKLPGIGPYTAAAVAAIAFRQPTVFIETNIRTVFHSFFYRDTSRIADKEMLELVEATLDTDHPREWYYALFDYGAMLKREGDADYSQYATRQSPFRGSNRQLRGQILRVLLETPAIDMEELSRRLDYGSERMEKALGGLAAEGFIELNDGTIYLK